MRHNCARIPELSKFFSKGSGGGEVVGGKFRRSHSARVHDPFAGGGAIPLEAQRLGLEAFASDLNPVAVLINKAMIEIPPKFADQSPVNSNWQGKCAEEKAAAVWQGSQGLAEDVRYYGKWIFDEAYRRVGHLYPPIEITNEMISERPDLEAYRGERLTVIAWLWARTVKSPNPAFATVDVPLASSFVLSGKVGREAYVEPAIEKSEYLFVVKTGKPPASAKSGTKASRGANFRCLMSQVPIEPQYIKSEAVAGRMGARLMAIVAEGTRGRVFLSPTDEHESVAKSACPGEAASMIHVPLAEDPRNLWCLQYGLVCFDDLFTKRQLVALTTFSDLVSEARERISADAVAAGLAADDTFLDSGGDGARAYADALSVYLAFAVDRMIDRHSSLATWDSSPTKLQLRGTFARQALPMTWDYGDGNMFCDSSGTWLASIEWVAKSIQFLPTSGKGFAVQDNAMASTGAVGRVVSTDPPYYDNIGYADLSDYFYVWLRRSLRSAFPRLFATVAVPKAEELVATPYRHGTKEKAERFFLDGMTQAMHNLAAQAHPSAPITIYYAFKQSETEGKEGTSSTGWETFLDAVLRSGMTLTGTWPMRTELGHRMVSSGTNALASSVILVCRPRPKNAGTISRRHFMRLLNESLPVALDAMTRESEGLHSPVAPVDLSQAIIGPGMAIFSRYEAVLEADGSPMSVRTALQLINRFLAEDDFDADTQFCLRWFEQHGWEAGQFGEADVLARAKGTSVEGVKQAGVAFSSGGSVRLYKWRELKADWDPAKDPRVPIWQVLHQLILAYDTHGESGAASLYAATVNKAEAARQLAYRLYTLCERRNWAEDARAYNDVVTGWSGIESAAAKMPAAERQGTLFAGEEIR